MVAGSESEDVEYDYSSEEIEDEYTAAADDDMDWSAVVAAATSSAVTTDNPNAAPMNFEGKRKHDTRCFLQARREV